MIVLVFDAPRVGKIPIPLPANPMSTQVTWVNSKHEPLIKDYVYNAAQLHASGNELRLAVRRAPWAFMIGFACLFLPVFLLVIWRTTDDLAQRWFGMIAGTICFGFACGIIFWLQSRHEQLGDYLVMNRARRIIVLPRTQQQFSFDQIVGFQTIQGRSKVHGDINVDFNLLVSEGGEIVRHYIMSNPSGQLVSQVVDFAGAKLDKIDLGRKGYRDADKRDSG